MDRGSTAAASTPTDEPPPGSVGPDTPAREPSRPGRAARLLRQLVRLPSFLALTLGGELLWLLGWLPARLLGRGEAWRAWVFGTWARTLLRLLGGRLEVRGEAGGAPGLVVCNHLSYLDVVVLGAVLPAVFVAKREVRSWPLLGPLAATMGTIFVDREHKRDVVRVGELLEARIAQGQTLVVFPEGTSSAGAGVLPFRPSLLAPFARSGRPVRYASIRYETRPPDPPASSSVAWWGEMDFPSHFLALLGLSRFHARLVLGGDGLHDPDRKQLAARLERAVAAAFEPMTAPDECPNEASSIRPPAGPRT